jgi:thioredoxin-like negative regulator of GroEL
MKLGVQGIPTLIFVNQGKEKDRLVGSHPAPVIQTKVEKLLTISLTGSSNE